MVKRFASFILAFLIISCLTSCQDKSQSPEQDLFATSSVMTVRKNNNSYTVLTLLLPEQNDSYGTFKCIAGPSEGEVTLVARPEYDCDFIGWSYDVSGDEIISYHNPYTFKVSRDVAVYPVFVKDDDIIDLKKLGIERYNTVLAYSELREIESISLYKPANLDLLVYFPYLKKIDIEFDSNTQCDISPMAKLANLEKFHAQGINLENYETLSKLNNLRILEITDSFLPIKALSYIPTSVEEISIRN